MPQQKLVYTGITRGTRMDVFVGRALGRRFFWPVIAVDLTAGMM
jgi:hypothetical protein